MWTTAVVATKNNEPDYTMKYRLFALTFSLLCTVNCALAQQEKAGNCFEFFLNKAKSEHANGNYKTALDFYEVARDCPDRPDSLSAFFSQKLETTKNQLDSALNAAKVQNEVMALAAHALSVEAQNPTMALRIAHIACQKSQNTNKLAIEVRRKLLENRQNRYYASNIEFADPISDMVVFPDGNRFFVGCTTSDRAYIYDIRTRKKIECSGHIGPINAVTISGDGSSLLSAGKDGKIILWDTLGNRIKIFESNKTINTVHFSPSGSHFITGDVQGNLRIWNIQTGLQTTLQINPEEIHSVDFLRDSSAILSDYADFTARLRQNIGLNHTDLVGHTQPIAIVKATSNNAWIATGSLDKTAKIWNAHTGLEMRTLLGHTAKITALDWSHDSKYLCTGSADHSVKLWSFNGHCDYTFYGHKDSLTAVEYSGGDSLLFTASVDKTVKIWKDPNYHLSDQLPHFEDVISLAASQNGRWMVTGSKDKTLKLWEIATGRLVWTFYAEDGIGAAAISPDNQYILVGLWSGVAYLLDFEGKLIQTFKGHTASIYSVGFSPNGGTIFTAGRDKTAIIWKTTGNQVCQIKHEDRIVYAEFSPDGLQLLTAGRDQRVKITQISNNKLSKTIQLKAPAATAAWSRDGKFKFIALVNGWCGLYSQENKRLDTLRFEKEEHIKSAAFDAQTQTLYCGTASGKILRLDLFPKLTMTKSWIAHPGGVFSVHVLPDGTLLSAGGDGKAFLWKTGPNYLQMMRTFNGHPGLVSMARIARNGESIITAGTNDVTIKKWDTHYHDLQTFVVPPGSAQISALAVSSPDAAYIVAGLLDGTVLRWDSLHPTEPEVLFKHNSSVIALDFSGNGRFLLSADATSVAIHDDEGKSKKFDFPSQISAASFSRNGQFALISLIDPAKTKEDIYWDWENKRKFVLVDDYFTSTALAFVTGDDRFAAGGESGEIRLWSAFLNKEKLFNDNGPILSLNFSSDDRFLISTTENGKAKIWDLKTPSEAMYPLQELSLAEFNDEIIDAGMVEDNQKIVVIGKKMGPVFFPNLLHQLDYSNNIAPLSVEQRKEFNLDYNVGSALASENKAELRDFARYFSQNYENTQNETDLSNAVLLFEKLKKLGWDFGDQLAYTELLGQKIANAGESAPVLEILPVSDKVVEIWRNTSDSLLPAAREQLYKALWAQSWYRLQYGLFEEGVKSALESYAIPSTNYQKNGVISNIALGYLLAGNKNEALKWYNEWKGQPWADERYSFFADAFKDDLKYFEKNNTHLTEKQLQEVREMLKFLQDGPNRARKF